MDEQQIGVGDALNPTYFATDWTDIVFDESEFHAVVNCNKARALRFELRKRWYLPSEKFFKYTGEDWLQCLLAVAEPGIKDQGAK